MATVKTSIPWLVEDWAGRELEWEVVGDMAVHCKHWDEVNILEINHELGVNEDDIEDEVFDEMRKELFMELEELAQDYGPEYDKYAKYE